MNFHKKIMHEFHSYTIFLTENRVKNPIQRFHHVHLYHPYRRFKHSNCWRHKL